MYKGIIFSLLAISSAAYAGWPVFNTLTPLEVSHVAVRSNCPIGKVRILAGTKVRIDSGRFNESWYWQSPESSQCFKPSKLKYLNISQTAYSTPGIIKTTYGSNNVESFSFIFQLPDEPWDCGYFLGPEIPNQIGCAQDQ